MDTEAVAKRFLESINSPERFLEMASDRYAFMAKAVFDDGEATPRQKAIAFALKKLAARSDEFQHKFPEYFIRGKVLAESLVESFEKAAA